MKYIVFGLFFFILCACSSDIKPTDLTYKEKNREVYVYHKGKPYDGTIWSEDKKSSKIIVDCGKIKRIEYYTSKGKLFCSVEGASDTYKKFYNEKGSEISRDDARELYWEELMNFKKNQRQWANIAKEHEYDGID